ncbi:MAG TPA: response regulator [Anaerolineae bacterium]|nr:response regulator [Anaerolineae bacterium]
MSKILLVEDHDMNRDMLSRRLRRKGYEVVTAVDGAMAITMSTEEKPDIILMDMSLPVVDGWEATRHIKGTAETAGIPIIAQTAHAMMADKQRCFDAGCDDYVTKPIDLPLLLDKIVALLASE